MLNNPVLALLVIGAVFFILLYLTSIFLRWLFSRLLGIKSSGKMMQKQQQFEDFLYLMGSRMERPWMIQELSVLSGESELEVGKLLFRAKREKWVQSEWMNHPVTDADFEGFFLSPKGVREFGKYAPNDRHSIRKGEQAREEEYEGDDQYSSPLSYAEDDLEIVERSQYPEAAKEGNPTVPTVRPRGIRKRR